MLKLGRDPFARQTIRQSRTTRGACDWCGTEARRKEVVIEPDTGRAYTLKGAFCSIDCARSYHGEA